jgi:surfeit locus 1 family protein
VEYLRVRVRGTFLHAKERHLYTVVKGKPGWKVVVPFRTDDDLFVMLDRGFVPDSHKIAEKRQAGQLPGSVTVTGLARAPARKGGFTPANDLDKNIWYWRDLDGMAASVLTLSQRERLVPFYIEAEAMDVPGRWPQGGVTRVRFTNRHIEYALTWYGLAFALASIYSVIVWRWRKYGQFT